MQVPSHFFKYQLALSRPVWILFYLFLLISVAFFSSALTYIKTKEQIKGTNQITPVVIHAMPNQQKIDLQQDSQPIPSGYQNPDVILHGPRDKKQVALTFDAEMTSYMQNQLLSGKVKSSYDKRIIDILTQTNTKATFFLTGMWITLYPTVTEELSKNPLFELGSHSYTDSSFSGACYGLSPLSEVQSVTEVGETEFLLKIYGGIENMLFRFPGGCYSPKSLALIKQASDFVVHWDVSGGDGFNNNTSQIVTNVLQHSQNGSIIILHLNGAPTAPKTAEALPMIIQKLKEKGFVFVKVNELLGISPEQRP